MDQAERAILSVASEEIRSHFLYLSLRQLKLPNAATASKRRQSLCFLALSVHTQLTKSPYRYQEIPRKKPLPLVGLCILSAHPSTHGRTGLRNERECAPRYQVSNDLLNRAVPLHHLSNILHFCTYALFCLVMSAGPSASPSAGRSSKVHVACPA